MDEQRKLLDELMGQERNLNEGDKKHRVRHFTDENLCKYHLAGLSPYSLFKNTKSDFGVYEKEFDDECRDAFQSLPQSEKDKYGYEYDLMMLLERLVSQCDQRVKRHADRIRLDHLEELEQITKSLSHDELLRFSELDDEIKKIEGGPEVEGSAINLGLNGKVDEAIAALGKTEAYKREITSMEIKAMNNAKEATGKKHMIVCDVSGNFMNSTDNGDRLRCHFEGKQYQGWKQIREKLAELRKKNPPPPPPSRGSDRRSDRRDYDDRRSDRRGGHSDRRERERDRDRGHRDDYRSSDRHRRSRSRSGGRRRR
mmetsp:Transcript_6247/g.8059  ORF Transcript_6247/g.8059 Transcript_6247/m.8059 type:complete len:312 (+) Transcript_6247:110-1045(+)